MDRNTFVFAWEWDSNVKRRRGEGLPTLARIIIFIHLMYYYSNCKPQPGTGAPLH